MRYRTTASMAEKEQMPNIGRIFRAIDYTEWAQAANHFRVLKEQVGYATAAAGAVFGAGKTVDNLQGAIDGELHEVEQMYPVYLETARCQNERAAERAFHFALEAEKIHVRLFQEAQAAAQQGRDMELGTVYVCPVCGHTTTDLPDACPVCGLDKGKYKHFTA